MKDKAPYSDVEHWLQELEDVPPRNPAQASRGRMRFLAEAANYREAVSQKANTRHQGWIFPIQKERYAMNILATILLATALLFGSGATVFAAQDDLPGEALYALKTLTEDIRLGLNADPQTEVEMLMLMAETRVMEMISLNNADVTPPAQVVLRLEQHIKQALQIAADLNTAAQQQALLQIQTTLQTQNRLMTQAHVSTNDDAVQLMTQTRDMLQTRLRLVDQGLADPQGLQNAIRNQNQNQNQNLGETPDPGGPNPQGTQNPGSGPGPGSNPQGTPAPGNGPGPNSQNTPGSGNPSGGAQSPGNGSNPGQNPDPGENNPGNGPKP